jgi:hypothetical protein
MVVAHLHGLLSHNHQFKSRSAATEEIILESISARLLATNMEAGNNADLALIPALTREGVTKTIENVSARRARVAELRLLDIYRVSEQISNNLKLANSQKELSLYQLYHLAEKTGIFKALDAHAATQTFRPVL